MHDTGISYCRIAYCLNEQGYTTPRGHKFKNTHVFSIFEKEEMHDKGSHNNHEIEKLRMCRINAPGKVKKMIKIRPAK